MNRVATLFSGPSVVVERVDHGEHRFHQDEDCEVTQSFAVTFVEYGNFLLAEDKQNWKFGQFDVLLSIPGIRRAYDHNLECPTDVCLSLSYAPDLVEEALGQLPATPLPPRVAAGTATQFALGRVLRALNSADAMAIECVVFDCTLAMGHSWTATGAGSPGARAHMRRIERACEAMIFRLAQGQSLTSLAREVGLSTFYFARLFREVVGESPHQYLLRARLVHAARLLRQGVSVTDAALDSGFQNLGHFTRTFRRRFGFAPAQYAKRSSQSRDR